MLELVRLAVRVYRLCRAVTLRPGLPAQTRLGAYGLPDAKFHLITGAQGHPARGPIGRGQRDFVAQDFSVDSRLSHRRHTPRGVDYRAELIDAVNPGRSSFRAANGKTDARSPDGGLARHHEYPATATTRPFLQREGNLRRTSSSNTTSSREPSPCGSRYAVICSTECITLWTVTTTDTVSSRGCVNPSSR